MSWLQGTLRGVTVTQVQLWQSARFTWQPPINAFRCESGFRLCADLAGVKKETVELTVERRRVTVRGTREAPEPSGEDPHGLQVLALEIDYGPFEREITLPAEVDVEQARAEQENGLLWIFLPWKK